MLRPKLLTTLRHYSLHQFFADLQAGTILGIVAYNMSESRSFRALMKSIAFIVTDIHTQPLHALAQSNLFYEIGEENIFGNIDDALNRARALLGLPRVERPGPFVPTVAREKI